MMKKPFSLSEFKKLLNDVESDINNTVEKIEISSNIKGGSENSMYGRIREDALEIIFDKMDLKPTDVFLDLGHGIGLPSLQAAYTRSCASRGIELDKNRNEYANQFKQGLETCMIKMNDIDRKKAEQYIVGDVEFIQGDFRDKKYWDFITSANKIFVNNAESIFSGRSSNDDEGKVCDDYIATFFAKTKPGTIMATCYPILALGRSVEEENKARVENGLSKSEKASFFECKSFDAGCLATTWTGDTKKRLTIWMYTRTNSDCFICSSTKECSKGEYYTSLFQDGNDHLVDTCLYCNNKRKPPSRKSNLYEEKIINKSNLSNMKKSRSSNQNNETKLDKDDQTISKKGTNKSKSNTQCIINYSDSESEDYSTGDDYIPGDSQSVNDDKALDTSKKAKTNLPKFTRKRKPKTTKDNATSTTKLNDRQHQSLQSNFDSSEDDISALCADLSQPEKVQLKEQTISEKKKIIGENKRLIDEANIVIAKKQHEIAIAKQIIEKESKLIAELKRTGCCGVITTKSKQPTSSIVQKQKNSQIQPALNNIKPRKLEKSLIGSTAANSSSVSSKNSPQGLKQSPHNIIQKYSSEKSTIRQFTKDLSTPKRRHTTNNYLSLDDTDGSDDDQNRRFVETYAEGNCSSIGHKNSSKRTRTNSNVSEWRKSTQNFSPKPKEKPTMPEIISIDDSDDE